MYILYTTNKLQDGGTHFATLLTITSSSSSNSILRKLDRGDPQAPLEKGAMETAFDLPWREAGPPNHHDDKVDSDQ